jgi:uncharacterized damage-inducible protein DinB
LCVPQVRWQPTLHTNHIAWLVWHMARVEDNWMSRLRKGPAVWQAEGWADRFRMDPTSTGNRQTIEEVRAMPEISLTDLLAYFNAVRAVTRQYLEQATDADLSQECPHPRGGTVPVSWVLGHILVEESQHLGQVALLRGMMRGLGA